MKGRKETDFRGREYVIAAATTLDEMHANRDEIQRRGNNRRARKALFEGQMHRFWLWVGGEFPPIGDPSRDDRHYEVRCDCGWRWLLPPGKHYDDWDIQQAEAHREERILAVLRGSDCDANC